MAITLYELKDSPHARKVRLLAAELGLPLEKVACDPRIGETRTSAPSGCMWLAIPARTMASSNERWTLNLVLPCRVRSEAIL